MRSLFLRVCLTVASRPVFSPTAGFHRSNLPASGWPAVIIVHGGGGTAYVDYHQKMWNKRWDTLPGPSGLSWQRLQPTVCHPERLAVNAGFPDPLWRTRQRTRRGWSYHVVCTIILAHLTDPQLSGNQSGKDGLGGHLVGQH